MASRSRICSGENSRAGRFEVYSWEFITGIFVCQWDWGGCNITVTICGPAGGGGFFFAAAARRHRLKSCFRFAPAGAGPSFRLCEKKQKHPQGGYAALENPLITGVIRYATTWQTGFSAECSGPSGGEALADARY